MQLLSNLLEDESASFGSAGRGEEVLPGDFGERVSRQNSVSNETLIFHKYKVNFRLEKTPCNPINTPICSDGALSVIIPGQRDRLR